MAVRTKAWIAAVLAMPLLGACGATATPAAAVRVTHGDAPTSSASPTAGGRRPDPSATRPSTTPTPAAASSPAAPAVPHFATPEAAMRYLATAYNTGDEVDLAHVTTPAGRAALDGMRTEAVDLRLVSCTANAGAGDYSCQFDHQFAPGHTPEAGSPPPPDGSRAGWAVFTVAPATGPGWYMTVLEHCD